MWRLRGYTDIPPENSKIGFCMVQKLVEYLYFRALNFRLIQGHCSRKHHFASSCLLEWKVWPPACLSWSNKRIEPLFWCTKDQPKKDTSSENMNVPFCSRVSTNIEHVFDIKKIECKICSVNDRFHQASRTSKTHQAILRVYVFKSQFGSIPTGEYVQPSTTTGKTSIN